MSRLLFITIAGNAIGYGHLRRCLSLAEHAAKRNMSITFCLFSDNEASLQIEKANYPYVLKPISTLFDKFTDELFTHIKADDVVIADFSHSIILQDLEGLQRTIKLICDHVQKLIVIDGLGDQTLATKIPNMNIDILVVPYVGNVPHSIKWPILEGPNYAVLSSAYEGVADRIVRQQADRVLVSCGGSDPSELTSIVMRSIEEIDKILNIRVIIGPLFSDDLKRSLRDIVSKTKHLITLIDAPEVLVDHMLWCDLAIATSGLIKYELAATGTPAILLSINDEHHLINQAFVNVGSVRDLGVSFTSQSISYAISELLKDYVLREKMASTGQQLVDGKGSERLISMLLKAS